MDIFAYKALFRHSPYPYLVMDTTLRIVGASKAYLKAVGRTEEALVGRYVFDAFPSNPNDPQSTNIAEVKASIARAVAKGVPDSPPCLRYAIPIQTENGPGFEERIWSTVHTPVMDENNKPVFVLQNAIDVTDLYDVDKESQVIKLRSMPLPVAESEDFNRAQMHEAVYRILNNEREHLRSLFDQAPGFVAVLMGPNHVFELANKAYYQLVGHRDIIGKTVWDALPEVAGQGFEEHLEAVFTTGKTWNTTAMPISIQREPNGPIEQRYVDLVYEPYRDRLGNIIGIFAQGHDVTSAVEAEASRRESAERLKDGLEAAKMIVWDWSLETEELQYSDNVENVMGIAPTTMSEVSEHIHIDDREVIRKAHEDALERLGKYQVVIRFIRPDNGKQIWVESRGRVLHDSSGKPVCIRGVTVDVTERHQAELELLANNRRKDEFLAMLSHELRNPLAPITTAAEMLRMVSRNDPKVNHASEVIRRQVKHMTNLVDDLLDASRVTRGLVKLDKSVTDIQSVIENAFEQVKPLVEAKNHAVIIKHDSTHPVVLGDRTRLVQIISNLLNNSAKYTAPGGEITLSVCAKQRQVQIEVADNGIGIDKDLLPSIFELFTQAQRTPDRSQGGLGIGLALVKTMVHLHGGTISVFSDGVGTGSKFTLSLPLYSGTDELSASSTDI